MTKPELATTVRRQLDAVGTPMVQLVVQTDGIYEDRGEWYVPVLCQQTPKSNSELFEYLAEVGSRLFEEDGLNIFLVPLMPGEYAA